MLNNLYDGSQSNPSLSGSQYANHISGISGLHQSGLVPPSGIAPPSSMTENGWQFFDRSDSRKTIWQYMRTLENGRHDQIRLNNHEDYGEKIHYHINMMVKLGEKPTKEQFMIDIAPKINRSIKKILERDEASGSRNVRVKIMRLCSNCKSVVEVSSSKICPFCGKLNG